MISSNVIITKDFQTMEKLFFGGNEGSPRKSLSDSLEELRANKKSIVSAPGFNNHLIELDFNIPNKDVSRSYVNIKFIESRELLEFFLLDASPLQTQLDNIYNLFHNANIAPEESLGRLNKYYIAFGAGDNLNEWAGPFVCSLGRGNVELENNVKLINLGFVLTDQSSVKSYTKKLYGNLGFGDDKLNNGIPKDSVLKYQALESLPNGLDRLKGPTVLQADLTVKRVAQKPLSWNPYIRRLLQKYLGKVYGGFSNDLANRVMVFLTEDFDEIFNKDLEKCDSEKTKDIPRNYQSKLKEFSINLRTVPPRENEQREETASRNREIIANRVYSTYHEHQGLPEAAQKLEEEFYKKIRDPKNFLLKE